MVRDIVKNTIFASLNYDVFRFEDFEISGIQYGDGLKIQYGEYYFEIRMGNENAEISYKPGSILSEEETEIRMSSFRDNIAHKIHRWLELVKEDMLNPISQRFITNEIDSMKEIIDEKIEEMENTFFTRDECDDLLKRLSALEENVSAALSGQEEKDNEIEKMKREIEFLKATVNNMGRKQWIKKFVTKLLVWGQKEENRKLLEAGYGAVKSISKMDDFPGI